MVRPSSAGPEWIELHNPNDFAIALKGWSLNHTSGSSSSNLLLQTGVIAGQSLSVLTGDPSSQTAGNASQIIDLGALGFLGVGQLDGLADGHGLSAYDTRNWTKSHRLTWFASNGAGTRNCSW